VKRSIDSVAQDKKEDEITIIADQEPQIDESLILSGFIQWQPYYDMYVLRNEIVITLELAGINLKDVIIYPHKSHVTIAGTRRQPTRFAPDSCTFHNCEIPYGRFFRRIEFPLPVMPEKLHYDVYNGLITLSFPIIQERVIPIEDS
jgi:HSP20 family molecular chaperone IbpA